MTQSEEGGSLKQVWKQYKGNICPISAVNPISSGPFILARLAARLFAKLGPLRCHSVVGCFRLAAGRRRF